MVTHAFLYSQQQGIKNQLLDSACLDSLKSVLFDSGQVGGMEHLGEVAEYLKNPHLDRAAAMALCKLHNCTLNTMNTIMGHHTSQCGYASLVYFWGVQPRPFPPKISGIGPTFGKGSKSVGPDLLCFQA